MIQELDEKDPQYEKNREVLQDVLGAVYAGKVLPIISSPNSLSVLWTVRWIGHYRLLNRDLSVGNGTIP